MILPFWKEHISIICIYMYIQYYVVCRKRRRREENSRQRQSPLQRPKKQTPLSATGTIRRLRSPEQMRLEIQGGWGSCPLPLRTSQDLKLFSEWHGKHRPVFNRSGARVRGQMEAHSYTLIPPLDLGVSIGPPHFNLEKIAEKRLSLREKWSGAIWSENSSLGYSSCNGCWGREDGCPVWSHVFGSY